MPTTVSKRKGGGFTVRTPGGIKAKRTTKAKAKAQARIINAADKKKRRK